MTLRFCRVLLPDASPSALPLAFLHLFAALFSPRFFRRAFGSWARASPCVALAAFVSCMLNPTLSPRLAPLLQAAGSSVKEVLLGLSLIGGSLAAAGLSCGLAPRPTGALPPRAGRAGGSPPGRCVRGGGALGLKLHPLLRRYWLHARGARCCCRLAWCSSQAVDWVLGSVAGLAAGRWGRLMRVCAPRSTPRRLAASPPHRPY